MFDLLFSLHKKCDCEHFLLLKMETQLLKLNSRSVLKWTLCIGFTFVFLLCLYENYYYQELTSRLEDRLQRSLAFWENMRQCKLPKLDPFNDDVTPYYKDEIPPNCMKLSNKNISLKNAIFKLKNGRYLHQIRNLEYPCCMRSMRRKDDEIIKVSSKCLEINKVITEIPKKFEYISVECKDGNTTKYRDAFPVVHFKKAPETTQFKFKEENPRLNVIILGFDSTSQQNFYRKAPQTRDFLMNELSAVTLQRYNKVGFNTRPNLVALLTGKTLQHLTRRCVRHPENSSETHLTSCPFIWKGFSNKGYLTAFMEDCSLWSFFNFYYKNAFPVAPTDYYYRPMAIYMDSVEKVTDIKQPELFCHGPRLTFVSMLNMMKMVVEAAQKTKQPFFQFMWSIRQTHGNLNGLGWLDKHMLQMLIKFQENNVLNTTALFIVSDHGLNFYGHTFAQTQAGQVEERMPVGWIVLPDWFKKAYPTAYQNLLANAEKRTTPYDIHATLVDLLDLEKLKNPKNILEQGVPQIGISLFRNIPPERTCLEASIPLQWCTLCFPKIGLPTDSPLVESAAHFLVASINKNLQAYRDKCLHLNLKGVQAAWKWDPRDVFSSICHHPSSRNIELNITCDFTDPVDVVRVTLITSPNNAMFDGEVLRTQHGTWILTENLTRIDGYWAKSGCVSEKEIKPYCHCKEKEVFD